MTKQREMTEVEIRRMHISDGDWERTHPTWKALKPRRNFNELRASDESRSSYAKRIGAEFGFPEEVLTQWLYGLYYDADTLQNYAWIDFSRVTFIREVWETQRLADLRVIENFQNFVDERTSGFTSVDDFACVPKDLEHWRTFGTWRVPPIAIDVHQLGAVPAHSDIPGRFQLVEGHSRMGYLRALQRIAPTRLAAEHEIFVLTGSEVGNTSIG